MKPLIVANWKMNPSDSKETFDLAESVTKGVQGLEADVVLCPPFVYVPQLLASQNVFIGAQNCFWEQEGPYTGEVSPAMLRNIGCTYVILGHSERRQLGETSEMVNKKIKAALMAGLIPVVCIGEKFEEEMKIIFQGIKNWKLEIKNLVLVYEPVWAVSTNLRARPAIPKDVKEAVAFMRSVLKEMFDERVAKDTTILYGGSVDSRNIGEFLGEDKAQGALVGGASLDAAEFVALVKNAILE